MDCPPAAKGGVRGLPDAIGAKAAEGTSHTLATDLHRPHPCCSLAC